MEEVSFTKKIVTWFDKFEDRVREWLSRRPILYTCIGGVAIVLFWRGVWMAADEIPFLTGPASILISVIILLSTGLFTSFFVGDTIIMSGLRKEKKIIEKTETQIRQETDMLTEIESELKRIEVMIDTVKKRD